MEHPQYTNVKMRYSLIFPALIIFSTICYSVKAEEIPVKYNIVKIVSTFENSPEKTGLGVVYSVREDSLVIVTVKSILESASVDFKNIQIQFANNNILKKATIVYRDSYYDLGVLSVEKPAWFVWNHDFKSEDVFLESMVFLLGRYGDLDDYSDRNIGRVIKQRFSEIDIESEVAEKGYPGTPVIYNDRIAAMVVHDAGNRILALPMKRIQRILNKILDIDINKYILGYPYIMCGMKSDFLIPISSSVDRLNLWSLSTISHGFFVELGIISRISVRFEKDFKNAISSHRLRVFDDHFQSRTELESFSVFLQYKEGINLYNTPNVFSYVYVGYTRFKQKPMLKINDEPWRDIREFDQVEYRISETINTFWLGANSNVTFRNAFVLRFDLAFGRTSSNLIIIDPLEPYKKQGVSWHLVFRLNVGFLLYNNEAFRNYIR